MLHAVSGMANDTKIPETIVSTLNLITMVGSQGWVPSSSSPLTNTTLDTTQGCLTPRAEIPLSVILVLAIVTFAVVVFFVYWGVLQARLQHFYRIEYRESHHTKEVCKAVPNGLIDWMVYVTQQCYPAEHVGARDLSKYLLVKDGKGHLKVALHGWFEADDPGSLPDEWQQPVYFMREQDKENGDVRVGSQHDAFGNAVTASPTLAPRTLNRAAPRRKPVGSSVSQV